MAGSLQRYYVLDGCGGVELAVLCDACATPEDDWLEAAYEDRYEPDYDA